MIPILVAEIRDLHLPNSERGSGTSPSLVIFKTHLDTVLSNLL